MESLPKLRNLLPIAYRHIYHVVHAHLHSLPTSHLLLAVRGILNMTQHKQEGQAMYLHGIHMADYQTEIFGEV